MDAEQLAEPDEPQPPPPPIPLFSPATKPILDTAGTHSIRLLWEAQRQTGTHGVVPPDASLPPCAIAHTLQMQQVKRTKGGEQLPLDWDAWTTAYQGPAAVAEVAGLRPGRMYAFRMVVTPLPSPFYGVAPPQPPSPAATFEMVPTPPGPPPPAKLVGRARNFLKFKWPEPEETGGRPITRYMALAVRPGNGAEAQSAEDWEPLCDGPDNSYKLTSLRPGVRVAVKFKVFNEVGESEWSKPVAFATAASVPDPPHGLATVEATTTSIAVHWGEPASNGDPISAYRLERDDGLYSDFNVEYYGPARVYEADKLVSGRVYRFRVCAINEAGRSMNSPVLEATTAATPPHSPAAPTVRGASQTTATLAWAPPNNDGGSRVTWYTLELQAKSKPAQATLGSEWHPVYEGEGVAWTLRQLLPGCTYRARVSAHNAAGQGDPSIAVDVATSATSPDPPVDVEAASRSRDAMEVQWTQPAFDGGAPVHSYRLEMRPLQPPGLGFSTAANAPEASAQVGGLEPGAGYEFRVYAVNLHGQSAPSASLVATTAAAPPLAPGSPQLAGCAAGDALRLAWAPPPTRGCPATSFSLQRCPGPAFLAALAVERRAVGDAAQTLNPLLPQENGNGHHAHAPAPVAAPKAVHWATVYEGKDAAAKVRGLEPHTRYAFRVRAASAAGAGDWSPAVLLATAAVAPSPPRGLAAVPSGAGSLRVAWRPPASDHGAPVTSYQVECAAQPPRGRERDAAWQPAHDGLELACKVAGLRSGRPYILRARATNARGSGPWCGPAEAATAAGAPEAPSPPAFSQVTATSLRAKWDPPAEDNGAAVLAYSLEVAAADEGSWREVYSGAAALARVSSLQPGQLYSFRVQARNAVGSSPHSSEADVTTAKPPPPPPADVTAQPVTADAVTTANATAHSRPGAAIRVSWKPGAVSGQHAACASYEVQATCATGGPHLRQTCAARVAECLLAAAEPGATYQVSVRSVGAGGAGHGTWSAACEVALPAPITPAVRSPPTDAAQQQLMVGSSKKGRAASGGGSGDEPPRARRRGAKGLEVPRSSRALPPPSRPPLGRWVRQQARQNRGLLTGTCFCVAFFALCVLYWRLAAVGDTGEPAPLRGPFGRYG